MLSNYYQSADASGNPQVMKGALTKAYFGNCQITGNENEELAFANDPTAGTFNYMFDHCAVQTMAVNDATHYNAFVRITNQFYRLPIDTVIGAVRNIGSMDNINTAPNPVLLKYDLFGQDRTLDGKPDAGAIEFVAPKKSK
jgi:hypothetical protein